VHRGCTGKGAEAAVDARDHALASDRLRESGDPLGDEFDASKYTFVNQSMKKRDTTRLIDMLVHRPRPEAALVHVIRHTNGWSFPSGHAVFFTWIIAYLLLILGRPHLPRPVFVAGWILQGIVLAIIAVGRVYTGEHWPSDVLAGLLLGAGWTLLGLSIRPLSDPVLRTRNA